MATRVFISYRRDDFLASGVGTLARALGSSNLAKPREDPGISVLMANEEEHIDFPKTQLDLVAKLGLELGAQHHIGKLDAD